MVEKKKKKNIERHFRTKGRKIKRKKQKNRSKKQTEDEVDLTPQENDRPLKEDYKSCMIP